MAEPIGAIVRLQVQHSSLKLGERPRRWYDPAAIAEVAALELASPGAVGITTADERILDLHNAEHPQTHNIGKNPISLGFTAHYAWMRERFGSHLADGIAGENVLVQTDHRIEEQDLLDGLAIQTAAGRLVPLERVCVAEPCVEFTRFSLRLPPDAPSDGEFRAAMDALRLGMRGFYARYEGEPALIRTGDRLVRR